MFTMLSDKFLEKKYLFTTYEIRLTIGNKYFSFTSKLTHLGRVTLICVYKMSSFVQMTAPSRFLNQCWFVLNWTLRTSLFAILSNTRKISLNMSSAIWRPFSLGFNVSNKRQKIWLQIPCTDREVVKARYVHRTHDPVTICMAILCHHDSISLMLSLLIRCS